MELGDCDEGLSSSAQELNESRYEHSEEGDDGRGKEVAEESLHGWMSIEVRCEDGDVTGETVEGKETDEERDGNDPEEGGCPYDGVEHSCSQDIAGERDKDEPRPIEITNLFHPHQHPLSLPKVGMTHLWRRSDLAIDREYFLTLPQPDFPPRSPRVRHPLERYKRTRRTRERIRSTPLLLQQQHGEVELGEPVVVRGHTSTSEVVQFVERLESIEEEGVERT